MLGMYQKPAKYGLQLVCFIFSITNKFCDVYLFFSLRTRVGTAINSDYGGISREDITFNTDESKKSISIQIIDDSVIEENENFTVLLETGNPRVLFSRSQTTVTIQDNDGKTCLDFYTYSVFRWFIKGSPEYLQYFWRINDCAFYKELYSNEINLHILFFSQLCLLGLKVRAT